MSLEKKLSDIQKKLNAPKSQFNNFGKYAYRNLEDILQAVKPLLGDCTIVISDDIKEVAGRVYVKATATFSDGSQTIENTAFAREPMAKKGMDESQITGAASSYARKYALGGLLLIDDNKDADSMAAPVRTVLDAYNHNLPCITAMREAFEKEDFGYVVQCWDEISGDPEADINSGNNDKTLLWVAPTKYKEYGLPEPVFSTELREFLKTEASKYR